MLRAEHDAPSSHSFLYLVFAAEDRGDAPRRADRYNHLRIGRVVAVLHAGGGGLLALLKRTEHRGRNVHLAYYRFEHLARDAAGTQYGGLADEGEHRRFHPHGAGAAVQNDVDAAVHILKNVLRGGGAGAARKIGRGRRDGHSRRPYESQRRLVLGHTDGDGRKTRRDLVGHYIAPQKYQREGPGPERVHEALRVIRHVAPKLLHVGLFGDVQYERIVLRAALGFEYPFNGLAVKPVRAQTVNGLRRERDEPARADHPRGVIGAVFLLSFGVEDLGVHGASFPPSGLLVLCFLRLRRAPFLP